MSWWLDITDLDEDQKDVIDLPPEGNYLILGPPGSGKTNLLLIRAEYLIRTGQPNICVLMYNDPLHDFVVRGGVHYDVPRNKIRKIMSWEIMLLREQGLPVDDLPDDLMQKRQALAARLLKLLDDQPDLEGHMACLLIDEVQDCLPAELEVFFRCAKNVCLAGDAGQRIFSSENVIEALKSKLKTIELKTHYRIGHVICRVADAVGKSAGLAPIEVNCNYKGPDPKVYFWKCVDDDEQAAKIIETLEVQLTAYPGELLGVAAPRIADEQFFRNKLENSKLGPYVLPHRESGSDDSNRRIYIAHLGEIKGLEFRVVHLGRMQYVRSLRSNQKRISYMAITRGKTTLSIYFTGTIPGYLEDGQVATEPPKPKPALADLFPKKSKSKS